MSKKKAPEAARKPKPVPVAKWRGLLADYSPLYRRVAFALLIVVSISLTFSQLGFMGIGIPGSYVAYAVSLLVPVVLGSVALGFGRGTLVGAVSGVIMLAHSAALPLDYYELVYVTPFSSVFQLTVSGLLCDWLLALVLRKRRHPAALAALVALVCLLISFLYSIGFMINIFAVVVITVASSDVAASDADESVLTDYAMRQFTEITSQVGDVGIQILADAVMMAIAVLALVAAFHLAGRHAGKYSLRFVFNAWLGVVVGAMFLLAASVCFAGTTLVELEIAEKDADGELDYIEAQVHSWDGKMGALADILERHPIFDSSGDLSEDDLNEIGTVTDIQNLFDGYDPEDDGYMLVVEEDSGLIALADFAYEGEDGSSMKMADAFSDGIAQAASRAAGSGKFERAGFVVPGEVKQQIELSNYDTLDLVTSDMSYVAAHRGADDGFLYVAVIPSTKVHESRSYFMAFVTAAVFVLLVAVFLLTSYLLVRVVTKRVAGLNETLQQITSGNLDATADERTTLEFDSLSTDVNTTVSALKGWIAEAESRIDTELASAKTIQESTLPRVFPPYPDILRFDIYASMKAAKEVGGDFYDFFLVGDDSDADSGKLGFVIADVSGKGIPAALFMMKADELVRNYMMSGMEPGEAVENANRQLCAGNDAGMFVTLFAGVLDYGSGHVEFVNAGHNPPLLWQRETNWRWLTEKSGLPLGLFDGLPYSQYSLDCQVGDQFLLYTDGVTEAMDKDGNLYGEDKLLALANANYPLHPRALVELVNKDVAAHAAGAEQSDDITVLALEVGVPPEITATLSIDADKSLLYTVNDFIHTELDKRLCPKRVQNQIDIAVEEMFVNVCLHAYPQDAKEKKVLVSYTYSAEPPSITIGLIDGGVPYDPTAKPDAVTPDNIDDVPIGGLGILMAKKNVDTMEYERVENSNVLTMTKKW